jgi:hypothetical protein
VSPESSLLQVGADGFIAQVWTGTARTPNVYEGVLRERTFETAFLEYGAMVASTRGSKGRLWFLHDPVEDDPGHSWEDYQTNWECTMVASLLWPDVTRYEIAPWPDRVFQGRYPAVDKTKRKRGEPVIRKPISQAYASELLTVMNELNHMDQSEIRWECGTRGIGVVVADTMMFQRGDPNPSDPHLGSFFGLALPLLEKGMPVEPVQLETASTPGNLDRYKVLLMTYEGMKPPTPAASEAIAGWVKAGGTLVFIDDDRDPFNHIASWWNQPESLSFGTPREALFTAMGLPRDAKPGLFKAGAGTLIFDSSSPAGLTYNRAGATHVRELVHQACDASKLAYRETDHLLLRRGPYVIGAGLGYADSKLGPEISGRFIDLFADGLPVVISVKLTPGRRVLLLDIDRAQSSFPRVLASACKILGERKAQETGVQFVVRGPDKTQALIRVGLSRAPQKISVSGKALASDSWSWDDSSKTLLVQFPNEPAGRQVIIE